MKKRNIILAVVAGVLILAAITSGNNDSDTNSKSVTEASEEVSEEISEEASLDSIIQAEIKESYEDFSITQNNDYLLVQYSVPEPFSADSFVWNSVSSYINICKEVYTFDDSITDIQIMIKTTFTDAKGNESLSKGIQFEMLKEVFETYNWDNLEYTSIYDQFSKDCKTFYINPAINYNTEKFYYVG